MNEGSPLLQHKLTAIVLAGQRSAEDPLVDYTGASCKALVEVDNQPLLLGVLKALQAATMVGKTLLSGPQAAQLEDSGILKQLGGDPHQVSWLEPQPTPSTSAYAAMQSLAAHQPVLVTSADQPFLSGDLVDEFCQRSLAEAADVTVGLAPYALVHEKFPDMKKTVLQFSDGGYCGCNLFAFMTPEGRRAADYWKAVESARKNPFMVIRILGWFTMLRYKLGWLSLPAALTLLSRRFGMRIHAVILPYAEAAIDVDSVEDYEIVQRAFRHR